MNTAFQTVSNRQVEIKTVAYSFGEEAVSKSEVATNSCVKFDLYDPNYPGQFIESINLDHNTNRLNWEQLQV